MKALFARTRTGETVELRVELPRIDLNVVDGFSMANNRSRTEVVAEIIAEWSKEKHREAMMICRTAGFNPDGADGSGRGSE